MGQRGEELASKFEQVNNEFTGAVEACSDADWAAMCKSEGWPFGVTAHHVAQSTPAIAGLIGAMATGGAVPALTPELLDAGNAAHAKEHANCAKDETLRMLRDGGAAAAAAMRGLGDDQLDKTGTFLGNELTAAQAAEGILIGHIAGHLESIKASAGA